MVTVQIDRSEERSMALRDLRVIATASDIQRERLQAEGPSAHSDLVANLLNEDAVAAAEVVCKPQSSLHLRRKSFTHCKNHILNTLLAYSNAHRSKNLLELISCW